MQARHYYQIIKRPMDLSVIRAKLNKGKPRRYSSPEEFVADVYLMFRNCAKFNYVSLKRKRLKRTLISTSNDHDLHLLLPPSVDVTLIAFFFLSDHSPTLRWPRQAAALNCSSPPSWEKFSQTEFSQWLRQTLTAMSTTRPTGPVRAVSPGQRGGNSATGRGRGDSRSSQGDITFKPVTAMKVWSPMLYFLLFVCLFFVCVVRSF